VSWGPSRLACGLLLALGCGGPALEGARPRAAVVEADDRALEGAVVEEIARLIAGPPGSTLAALFGSPPRPLWSEGGRPNPLATRAVALLRAAADHGLLPSDYDAPDLERATAALLAAPSPPAADVARFEVGLGAALLRYLEDVHGGRVDPRSVGIDFHAGEGHRAADLLARALARGDLAGAVAEAEPAFAQYGRLKAALSRYRGLAADAALQPVPAVKRVEPGATGYAGLGVLARLLHALGDLPDLVEVPEGAPYDGAVREAVERFQARHGLAVDGILGPATFRQLNVPLAHRVGQLELALERLRWLPHAPPGRFLVVNVPAFRLVAFESAASDRPSLQMGVVVGQAARTRTPLFADAVRHVIFRPFWYPPRSIIVKEILPALRRNPGYLARERLEIVARGHDQAPALPATPANLARLAEGALQLRQQSGEHNALGLVKFVFPNTYDVYLHDTPAKGLFARPRRDSSHGCIRVERAPALAAFLLDGRPEWTPERIAEAMNGTRTLRVDLPRPVPVFIYYTTAIVRRDGTVEFFDDIYGKDEALRSAPRRRVDGHDRAGRGGDHARGHAPDERAREPGAAVRAHHDEADAPAPGQADDLLVGDPHVHHDAGDADAGRARLLHQAAELLLGRRALAPQEHVPGLRRDLGGRAHRHRGQHVRQEQLGAEGLRRLDRLVEGGRGGRREVRGMEDPAQAAPGASLRSHGVLSSGVSRPISRSRSARLTMPTRSPSSTTGIGLARLLRNSAARASPSSSGPIVTTSSLITSRASVPSMWRSRLR
jgi:murein L,D-transpeptidase YcbB/YkuD